MNSPKWRRRREQYFALHDKICAACKSEENIHLHHLNYDNFGAEEDIDLLPLCQKCHNGVHRLQARERISIASATKVYIQMRKRPRRKKLARPAKRCSKKARYNNRTRRNRKPRKVGKNGKV
jgi:hypothetical protein